ncbi:MAG: ABC transporter permease [Burkholderiaceae bacterium]|nr:ABC transporter permease [Burkholderiaceae bacterium]
MLALLKSLSWPELRRHRWRNATALLAVALGVALAFSVQLINASALAEFGAAVRAVNGAADFELRGAYRGVAGSFDERLYARVAAHPQVAIASPVVEIDAVAIGADGRRVPLRVLGLDMLVAAPLAPALLARPFDGEPRFAVLDPDAVFLNPAARQALGLCAARDGPALGLQRPGATGTQQLRCAGTIAAPGPPLALIDIAGAQSHFGLVGRLSRIDVRLAPGADRDAVLRDLALPLQAVAPDAAAERLANVSRSYRVNLTVLALVALFTGAFLVFSVLSLAVARRTPQFALLGVLGMTGGERLRLVVTECALLGLFGSVLGLALGTALAAFALRWLAGDLGAGYFQAAGGGAAPLQFSVAAALVHGALGIAAAVAGGWLPARAAQRLAPAQALKGVALSTMAPARPWVAGALLAAGGLLAFAPPLFGLPLGAYAAVGCVLLGGIACVPAMVALLLRRVDPPGKALALLAIERARRETDIATIAVAGVVASLALAVALTVMVASFRDSMTRWLDAVLPAALYVRAGAGGAAGGENAFLAPPLVHAVSRIAGIERVQTQRVTHLQLAPARPAVALIARPLTDPAQSLPLVGDLVPARPGTIAVYASEAMASLYGATPGSTLDLPLPDGRVQPLFVRGVWRDYARQQGTLAIDAAAWRALTGDARVNSLAIWLAPGADMASVQQAITALAARDGAGVPIDFATPGEIRAVSLRIFDRSFAVTTWLQAVAIGIGLAGIAASFSAQVLARRKEFGLLAHLGLTRRQIVAVVSAEGAVWTAAGTLLGLLLGLAVSVILVKVVNPQSFHWTMELALPAARLALLCGAVLAAGSITVWLASRALAAGDMALAVKEDW